MHASSSVAASRFTTEGFVIGRSLSILTLERVTTQIAGTNIPILVTGESGTGKSTYARRIHDLSLRTGPLIRIACATANAERFLSNGEFNFANDESSGTSATLFLDEISELNSGCQGKLLYALADEGVIRDGSHSARVISTTSRDLENQMHGGHFRRELFYRLNGVCLELPPLRERREDIELLVEWFLIKYAGELGRQRPELNERTRSTLVDYPWPGNIRELENVIKKIVALNDQDMAVADLSKRRSGEQKASFVSTSSSLKAAARAASRDAERELILKTLTHTRWNRKRAAQELQISYKSLLYKLKQIGKQDPATN